MKTRHARVKAFLEKAVEKAERPLAMSQWYQAVENEAQVAGYSWDEWDLGPMGSNPAPAWRTIVRVLLNGWHHDGLQIVRLGKGVYAPLHISAEDLADEEAAEEVDDATGFIYAYALPMAPGLIKIGETQNIEKRMAQHVILHKNAHLPDRPVLLQVWKERTIRPPKRPCMAFSGCEGSITRETGPARVVPSKDSRYRGCPRFCCAGCVCGRHQGYKDFRRRAVLNPRKSCKEIA